MRHKEVSPGHKVDPCACGSVQHSFTQHIRERGGAGVFHSVSGSFRPLNHCNCLHASRCFCPFVLCAYALASVSCVLQNDDFFKKTEILGRIRKTHDLHRCFRATHRRTKMRNAALPLILICLSKSCKMLQRQ